MQTVGRLGFREEGKFWCCYICRLDSMKGAQLLGSVAIGLSDERKEAFMRLMEECYADMLEDITGHRPVWSDPVQAGG